MIIKASGVIIDETGIRLAPGCTQGSVTIDLNGGPVILEGFMLKALALKAPDA